MSDKITVSSSRFGELEVPATSVIEILGGVLGFSKRS